MSPTLAPTAGMASRAANPKLARAAWLALFFNAMGASAEFVIPIPSPLPQLLTQGALPAAFVFAWLANPRREIRPSMFVVLLSVMALVALPVSLHNEFFLGSVYRSLRFLGFVAVLWLLTPWFGRPEVLLANHVLALKIVIGSVVLGALVLPGHAFAFDGRLAGALWPIWTTQVAHYAATLLGITALLWMAKLVRGGPAAITVAASTSVLLLTHTRTALIACLIGLAVATASLLLTHLRARRVSSATIAISIAVTTVFATQITRWLLRGDDPDNISDLTGRAQVWRDVFGLRRDTVESLFGSGMSNMSFNGLPIDSNWVATYLDLGWLGVTISAATLLLLLFAAANHVRGPYRAIAVFVTVYCVVASFTETGLGAPSPYLLDLTIAAALLSAPDSTRPGTHR